MPITKVLKSVKSRVPVKVWTNDCEPEAEAQLYALSQMPFVHKHVACMPDVHAGKGSTIGSVIATKGAIIPAAVGVDIGCGMMAQKLSLAASDLPDNLQAIQSAIESAVPHGFKGGDFGDADLVPQSGKDNLSVIHTKYSQLQDKHPKAISKNFSKQMGTLGSGNHFIELCLDGSDAVWIMLHSGSRGMGNRIGTYFISKAKEEMERWYIAETLPDTDLAYLVENTEIFDDYVGAMFLSQKYASMNREVMMESVLTAIAPLLPAFTKHETAANCHHNYVSIENHFDSNVWVTRKGAVRARTGDLGIIPGSMGAKSFIVRGLGNAESFHSCSHGAGRRMSRTKARNTFTKEDLEAQTMGVQCRKDVDVIDEIPGAYKDIDEVMANQSDLVEIVHTLKQVVCVKG